MKSGSAGKARKAFEPDLSSIPECLGGFMVLANPRQCYLCLPALLPFQYAPMAYVG